MNSPTVSADQETALRELLDALLHRSVGGLLGNGHGLRLEVEELGRDGTASKVPLLVSDGLSRGPQNASIASPHGHYLAYPLVEAQRRTNPIAAALLAPVGPSMRAFSRLTRFDRVVFVNHWLFVPGPPLEQASELGPLIERLRRRYPDHALVFSGLTAECTALGHDRVLRALLELGGRHLRRRTVYLFDPHRRLSGQRRRRVHKLIRHDLQLLDEARSRAILDPDELLGRVDEMRRLYEHLFFEQHPTGLNTHYTEDFLRIVLSCPLFRSIAWQGEDGRLEAFCCTLHLNHTMIWSICGYQGPDARERGLFRRLYVHDLEVARETGQLLHVGAGNGPFKRFRGAQPTQEMDVVFDRHLSARRRLPWTVLRHLRPPRLEIGEDGT